jgi:hypothetical protein
MHERSALGQPHRATAAVDQRLAELALERPDLLADRGLADAKRLRRRRERAPLGNLEQRAQMTEVGDKPSLCATRERTAHARRHTCMRQFATVVAVLALTADCGCATARDGGSRPASEPSSKATEPAGSSSSKSPPGAYLETPPGRARLTLGSYCWSTFNDDGSGTTACADMVPPDMRDDLAEISIASGDRVTLHLAFEPPEPIEVVVGGHTRRFPPAETVSWTVIETGILNIFVDAEQGSVSYLARLVRP